MNTKVEHTGAGREPDDYGPGVRAALAAHQPGRRTERVEVGMAGCGCPITSLMYVVDGELRGDVPGTDRTEHDGGLRGRCWDDRRILDVADAYREALAEYLWREMSTGDSAEWIPFDEGEYEADGREESERIIAAIRTDGATVDPAEMTGPAYSVEHHERGLPSPDAHAVVATWTLEKRIVEQLPSLDQAALARLVVAIRELQDADAIHAEYEPAPLLRSELVRKLDHRRDVFAYVYVPVDGRAPARLGITRVHYLSDRDHIALYTAPWYLGIEQDGPAYTPALTLSASEIEHLLCTHDGLRMQALDTGDETTWHDLSTVVECEDEHLLPADEGDEPDADPDYDACVVLVSAAFPAGGVMHTPPAEGVAVRIEVAR